jgi:hypothetical protein
LIVRVRSPAALRLAAISARLASTALPGHLQPAVLRPGLQRGRLSYGDDGYLAKSGADVTWDSQVPLG